MDYLAAAGTLGVLPVLVAATAMMLVSILWVSPLLFGRAWVRLSGVRPGDIRPADARRNVMVGIVTSLLGAALLGLVAMHAGERPAMLFFGVGFLWLFVMLEQLNHTVWERQPFALFLLQTFRSLAALMAGAAVFHFWS